jgi:hypothetical protein
LTVADDSWAAGDAYESYMGPAYVASLAPRPRALLRDRLASAVPRQPGGAIHLSAKAWALAVRQVPG